MSGQEIERLRLAMAFADGYLVGTVGALLSFHEEGSLPPYGWKLLRESYDKCRAAEERWKGAVAMERTAIPPLIGTEP